MSKIHNYSAGPCILPQEVFQEASQAVLNFNNTGLSILEMSHRSKEFVAVMEEAKALVREVLNVPDDYAILFLQGGASTGFLMTAYNFLRENSQAAYLDTGTWSSKAIKEAAKFGEVNVVASSKSKNYSFIPKGYEIPESADYFHCTSNNTIYGTQMKSFPNSPVDFICDMSSDIFSKPINVADFGMIYAGAQKNLGPAGATLYIVKRDLFKKSKRDIPSMLDLEIHDKKDSMFNTPPVYPTYVSMLNLRYLKNNGGVVAAAERNEAKAKLLYDEIDRNPLFKGVAEVEDRSLMNATFVLTDESAKETFDQLWQEAGISGIKGHRSIGGYRASMYNALPIESVQVLVDCMKAIESKI